MAQPSQVRTYIPAESVVFLKTNERFGGLSNMAPGFPLVVNGVRIRTSEALYQACRFPSRPDVQRQIIDDPSPMTAKMRSKPFRGDSRPDWDAVRVKTMRWCLRVKLAQNWREFGKLLLATGDRPIVEQSRKDDFWGAMVAKDGRLVGMNVLGRLLMELREQLKSDEAECLRFIEPLAIPKFLLFGRPIEAVQAPPNAEIPGWPSWQSSETIAAPQPPSDPQPSLFEQPMITNAQPAPVPSPPSRVSDNQEPRRQPVSGASGHDWLSDIPSGWDVLRSKHLFCEIDDRTDTGTETLLSMRQAHGLIPHAKVSNKPVTAEELKGYKRVRTGQLVLNRMQASNGMFAVAREDGLVSPDYAVFQPLRPMEPDYYVELFKTAIYRAKFRQESKGLGTGMSGFLRLYSDRFGAIHVPQPSEHEQRMIVQFIRAYDLRVRRLIRNKRRLIRLLNEQKQAIINRAVTRGLNPNAPMKPTGIDWMPEVPAHWEVKMLSRLAAKLQTGPFGSQLHQADYVEDGVPIINPMHLIDGTVRPDRQTTVSIQTAERLARHALTPGEIVIARRGELGRCALVREVDGKMLCGTGCMTLRLSEGVPRFFFEFLSSASVRRYFDERSIGATMQNLNPSIVGAIQAILPPKDEQEQIIREIDDINRKFSSLERKAEDEIRLVREYRERLISDVVTGKLDVRHIEIAAPADEPISDGDDLPEEDLEADDADVMEGANADE